MGLNAYVSEPEVIINQIVEGVKFPWLDAIYCASIGTECSALIIVLQIRNRYMPDNHPMPARTSH